MTTRVEHLFVVGAGFSAHAGLPLTTNFTRELLNTKHMRRDGPSSLIIEFLRGFVGDVFLQESATAEEWPQLEDIFTSVDLAANSGHHLGAKYAPSDLRTVRRALLTRTIRMLYQTHGRGETNRHRDGGKWDALETFFSRLAHRRSAFLSMNWDTVIEEGVENKLEVDHFDYGCDALRLSMGSDSAGIADRPATKTMLILKPHGSANWLYCDLCRQLFWVDTDRTESVAKQLFGERDWIVVDKFLGRGRDSKVSNICCPRCGTQSLGTRFATFSYRKALDFPMHLRTWLKAERVLREAETWTFIGYSMPGADYEFKHLLKQVQLSREPAPAITVITGGTGADATQENYERFLGRREITTFKAGIDDAALAHLASLGALRSTRA